MGSRPAAFSFSPAAGQVATLSANAPVGVGGAGLAGSPWRSFLSAPLGTSAAWAGGGWSASFASGRDRGPRLVATSAGRVAPALVRAVALSTRSGSGWRSLR